MKKHILALVCSSLLVAQVVASGDPQANQNTATVKAKIAQVAHLAAQAFEDNAVAKRNKKELDRQKESAAQQFEALSEEAQNAFAQLAKISDSEKLLGELRKEFENSTYFERLIIFNFLKRCKCVKQTGISPIKNKKLEKLFEPKLKGNQLDDRVAFARSIGTGIDFIRALRNNPKPEEEGTQVTQGTLNDKTPGDCTNTDTPDCDDQPSITDGTDSDKNGKDDKDAAACNSDEMTLRRGALYAALGVAGVSAVYYVAQHLGILKSMRDRIAGRITSVTDAEKQEVARIVKGLKKTAGMYKTGSVEHRAVEDEIAAQLCVYSEQIQDQIVELINKH